MTEQQFHCFDFTIVSIILQYFFKYSETIAKYRQLWYSTYAVTTIQNFGKVFETEEKRTIVIDINANIAYIRRTTPAQTKKAEPASSCPCAIERGVAPREDVPVSKKYHECATPGCGRLTFYLHCYTCNWG
jgi:hypothetical protein